MNHLIIQANTLRIPLPDRSVQCVVLDPFSGAGTTVMVSENLGRIGIGCELSAKYCRMSVRRINRPHAKMSESTAKEDHPLFAGLEEP